MYVYICMYIGVYGCMCSNNDKDPHVDDVGDKKLYNFKAALNARIILIVIKDNY